MHLLGCLTCAPLRVASTIYHDHPHLLELSANGAYLRDPTRAVPVAPGPITSMLCSLRSSRFHSLGAPQQLLPCCPTSRNYFIPFLSIYYNDPSRPCSLVLLPFTAEPPPGIKPKCVVVASPRKETLSPCCRFVRASRPLSLHALMQCIVGLCSRQSLALMSATPRRRALALSFACNHAVASRCADSAVAHGGDA
jgi:hypothetical protein